jgi:dipeptidyl aminopeptidase/acylaminoacyl peptidase
MINGWKYVLEKYPEIDPDRAVAAGASWGGYAIKCVLLYIMHEPSNL